MMGLFGRDVPSPQMVKISPGEFLMGAPDDEEGRRRTEGPQHRVCIAYRFEVGKYPVTFAEWDAAVKDGGCNGYRPYDGIVDEDSRNEAWGRGTRPVVNVSWYHAGSYISWLNRRTGKTYRLLSEAEWEYCCRAGTTTPYAFGGQPKRSQANFSSREPLPVDRFPANQFGLVGMHGNVWEWCQDCWNENYDGAPSDGSAWLKGNCNVRILRGGSWNDGPSFLRSAYRLRIAARHGESFFGFRLARTP